MFGAYIALASLIVGILGAFAAGVWRFSALSTRLEMKVDQVSDTAKKIEAEMATAREDSRRLDRAEGAIELIARALGVRLHRRIDSQD